MTANRPNASPKVNFTLAIDLSLSLFASGMVLMGRQQLFDLPLGVLEGALVKHVLAIDNLPAPFLETFNSLGNILLGKIGVYLAQDQYIDLFQLPFDSVVTVVVGHIDDVIQIIEDSELIRHHVFVILVIAKHHNAVITADPGDLNGRKGRKIQIYSFYKLCLLGDQAEDLLLVFRSRKNQLGILDQLFRL